MLDYRGPGAIERLGVAIVEAGYQPGLGHTAGLSIRLGGSDPALVQRPAVGPWLTRTARSAPRVDSRPQWRRRPGRRQSPETSLARIASSATSMSAQAVIRPAKPATSARSPVKAATNGMRRSAWAAVATRMARPVDTVHCVLFRTDRIRRPLRAVGAGDCLLANQSRRSRT